MKEGSSVCIAAYLANTICWLDSTIELMHVATIFPPCVGLDLYTVIIHLLLERQCDRVIS